MPEKKKAYVCKIALNDKVLVYDVIDAAHAEAALQTAVPRHRRKLSSCEAATSFGQPQKLENDFVSFKNGGTVFSSELLSKVLERLGGIKVDIDNPDGVAAMKSELTLIDRALKNRLRNAKK